MKMTLLEIVQSVLNDMDGDEVNSIDDTVESSQVASIVKDTYYAMLDGATWPHLKRMVTFTNATTTQPTKVTAPDELKELVELRYDVRKTGETRRKYKAMEYLHPDQFLDKTNGRNSDATNVDIIDTDNGMEILIRNDVAPQYWTSFDDEVIFFDAYDSAIDSTISAGKMQALGYISPAWTASDSFTPDLPSEAFTKLLEDSKSAASLALKQMPNDKAEQRSRKASQWLSRKSFQLQGGVRYRNFGRQGKKSSYYASHPLDKDN